MIYPNDTIQSIHDRRSVREFTGKVPTEKDIEEVLNAGIWAPSGLNNQPWRFIIVTDAKRKLEISLQTHYSSTIESAPILICIFMDEESSYDRTKDLMGMGACSQNILLAAHSLGLGAVWLGEILKNKENVRKILNAPRNWELTAVIAIGYAKPKKRSSNRKNLKTMVYADTYNE